MYAMATQCSRARCAYQTAAAIPAATGISRRDRVGTWWLDPTDSIMKPSSTAENGYPARR